MKSSNEKEKGSVQVVEFTYVFPVVLLTVLVLIVFIMIFSFYISSFYITEWAVTEATSSVGTDGRLYWQLSGRSIPDTKYEEIEKKFNKHLRALSFIPGISFSGKFSEERGGRRFKAVCSMSIRGKTIFKIDAVSKGLKPIEFARNVDLLQELEPEEGFYKVLEDKFGHILERDKAYEVFQ